MLPSIMKKTIFIAFFILLTTNYGFSQNESIMKLVEKTNGMKLDMWDLTEFAQKHLKEKEELARFFYYWTSTNIQYDDKSLKEKNEGTISLKEYSNRQNEYEVYENRKGVCAGYSNLFKWFMDEVDIEATIISGHIRDERNHYVELTKDDSFRHGWNAIKLNEKWILVDTTWGTANEFTTSEFYFDMKPEWAIITHFPEEGKWQLLEKPLTLQEFNNSKFISPIWFLVGYSDIPKIMADKDYYYFVFKNNPNSDWSVNLQYSTDNINFESIHGIDPIVQDGYTYYRFDKSLISDKTYFKVNISELKPEENQYLTRMYKDVINFKI